MFRRPSVRLNSNQMFDNAFYRLIEGGAEFQEMITADNDPTSVYAAKFTRVIDTKTTTEQQILLVSPACDLEKKEEMKLQAHVSGTSPLPIALKFIHDYLQKEETKETKDKPPIRIFLPLAESHKRFHWTLLTMLSHECFFLDPKAKKTFPYSLTRIENQLKANHFNAENKKGEFNAAYTAIQPWRDSSHCGHVTAFLIFRFTYTSKIQHQLELLHSKDPKIKNPEMRELKDLTPALQKGFPIYYRAIQDARNVRAEIHYEHKAKMVEEDLVEIGDDIEEEKKATTPAPKKTI